MLGQHRAVFRCTLLVAVVAAIELTASATLGRFRGTLAAEALLALGVAALVCRSLTRRWPDAIAGAALAVALAALALPTAGLSLPLAWILGIAIAAGAEEVMFRELLPARLARDLAPAPPGAPGAARLIGPAQLRAELVAVVLAQLSFAAAHLAAAWPQLAPARFAQLFVAGLLLYGAKRLAGLWLPVFLHATLNVQALSSLDDAGWYGWRLTAAITAALGLIAAARMLPTLRCIFSTRCPTIPASTPSANAAPNPAAEWTSRPS
jgi:membrane protease YdiL (CAAX protease family)